jgi:hypothetical protein
MPFDEFSPKAKQLTAFGQGKQSQDYFTKPRAAV